MVKNRTGNYLFSTLAYQLVDNVDSLHPYVDEVMSRNPTLPTKPMKFQFRSLIMEPLNEIIDGQTNANVIKCRSQFYNSSPKL